METCRREGGEASSHQRAAPVEEASCDRSRKVTRCCRQLVHMTTDCMVGAAAFSL